MKMIEKGIIGEGMVGRNVRCFISVIGRHTFFGFRDVRSGEILEFEEVEDMKRAISKVIDHAKTYSL